MKKLVWPIITLFLISSPLTWADDDVSAGSVYSFGGSCSSLGSWSQMALTQGGTLRSAVTQLRDDPNCKGIESILPSIEMAQDAVASNEANSDENAKKWDNLPQEISALTQILGDQATAGNVVKTMLGKSLDNVVLGANAFTFKDRSVRMAKTGLDLIDKTATVLPQYEQCLFGHPDQAVAIFGAALKLTSSYIASGETMVSKAGNSVAKLVDFLRQRKFSKVLSKLNQTEYWMSMSCILETTTEAYCATKDAYEMLEVSKKDERLRKKVLKGEDSINPLEGYYLLVREIPIISNWLSKARFGVTPRLRIDGNSKNSILENVNDMFKDRFDLLGAFGDSVQFLKKIDDVKAKQNYLLNMIDELTSIMGGGKRGYGSSNADEKNFFTMAVLAEKIPFVLIGRDEIPDDCSGKGGKYAISWQKYMLNQGNFIEEFEDPDKLAAIVGENLKKIIEKALDNGNAYYQQRMLVDINNLVDESLTSQNITVLESFVRTQKYLTKLIDRIVERQEPSIILPNLLDTKIRIDSVLSAYADVRGIVKSALNSEMSEEELRETILGDEELAEAYRLIISRAFSEFNVIFQRETFLLTRLETFVKYDYADRINNYDDLSQYQRDMMIVAGKNLIGRLTDAHQMNPTDVELDLSTAQAINSRNIDAVEELFANAMLPMISELKLIAEGRGNSNTTLNMDTLARLYGDSLLFVESPYRDEEEGFFAGLTRSFKRMMFSPGHFVYNLTWHGDRYDFHGIEFNKVVADDDMYGSFEKFKSRICIQSLAFRNYDIFEKLCRGSELESYHQIGDENIELSTSYDQMLDKHIDVVESEDRDEFAKNRDENICAFRNYSRKNHAYSLIREFE